MSDRATCVLCLRTDHPMTHEHVFAHWLVRKVQGARLVPTRPESDRGRERISRVVADVCAECNHGWMSGLEVSFRHVLFARPRAGNLLAPDRTTLARWFTKTALLLAKAHDAPFLAHTRGAAIVRGMPEDVEVFIARRRRAPQPLDFWLDRAGDGEARSVAIVVDDVVGRVAKRGTLAGAHGTQLWPLRTHTLRFDTLPVITGFAAAPRKA